ncbi:uncharacterized protein [Littorina saxatilis]|uniref:uncharacterized protein isoform X1 n=1 Tax=Littorina saxatilis TaxID=31220 RepID=UPI0038B65CF1
MARSHYLPNLVATGLVLVLGTPATALPTSVTQPEVGQGTSPYCVPEEWQGGRATTLGVVNTSFISTVTQNFGSLIYSAKLQKILIDDNLYSGQYRRRIYDYPANILYTITGSLTQKCKKTTLPGPFAPQCVPADATVLQTDTSFGVETNSVTAIELSGIQNDVKYRVTLTRETNVPIFEELWGGKNGDNFYQALSFYNFTMSTGLPASVFKPPSACDHVPITQLVGRSIDDVIHPLVIYPWV